MDESDYMTRIVLRSAANVIETLVVERKGRDGLCFALRAAGSQGRPLT